MSSARPPAHENGGTSNRMNNTTTAEGAADEKITSSARALSGTSQQEKKDEQETPTTSSRDHSPADHERPQNANAEKVVATSTITKTTTNMPLQEQLRGRRPSTPFADEVENGNHDEEKPKEAADGALNLSKSEQSSRLQQDEKQKPNGVQDDGAANNAKDELLLRNDAQNKEVDEVMNKQQHHEEGAAEEDAVVEETKPHFESDAAISTSEKNRPTGELPAAALVDRSSSPAVNLSTKRNPFP